MSAVPPAGGTARPGLQPNETHRSETLPGVMAALSDDEFAALMAPLGGFETYPLLAVAVSGGADSLALCLLADAWSRLRHGTVVGLTVDHGLRAGSAAEAVRVGSWLAARGIAHHILGWRPPVDRRNVQAAARAARYRLLTDWCTQAGCLHLLTAHHREDQAETLLLRLARGSGLDGLAGMAALRDTPSCRLLRPLLDVPRARLAATLRAAGQAWIDDPSNLSAAFARTRLRGSAALLAREGLGPARLAATARRLGRARAALEAGVTGALARAAWLHPAGFAALDADRLAEEPAEIGLRALARLAMTIGGADHAPRLDRLERLYQRLLAGLPSGRTLGGCRFARYRDTVIVCREPAAVEPPRPTLPGTTLWWDGRFSVELAAGAPSGLTVGALGSAGFGRRGQRGGASLAMPAAARATLPALFDLAGVVAVPHLNYVRADLCEIGAGGIAAVEFRPKRPLSALGFTVV